VYETTPPLLLSRVAEAAYWAGRYLERAEGTARLIKTHSDLVVDLPLAAGVGWAPVLAVMGVDDLDPPTVGSDGQAATNSRANAEETVLAHLVASPDNLSSVRSSIAAVHTNLRLTRSVMPVEAAEVLIDLHNRVDTTANAAVARRTRGAWLTSVIRGCQTLTGTLAETMSHDDAYGFFTIGRQIERADMVSRVLDVQSLVLTGRSSAAVAPYADLCWAAVLRSVSALQAFRRRGVPNTPEATLSFLLQDPRCPRTIESCLIEASRWLLEIPRHEDAMAGCAELQLLISDADIELLVNGGLHDFVDRIQLGLGSIHDLIGSTWFASARAEVAG
jgi:uncharacterized alpha-E superfamily protein